jgi:hypothetical protein
MWDIARTIQDPEFNLVLYRNGIALPAQAVVVKYLTSGGHPFASSHTATAAASVQTTSDIRLKRPLSRGFNVQVGDRFRLETGETGNISQVTYDEGMIWASGTLDTGSP